MIVREASFCWTSKTKVKQSELVKVRNSDSAYEYLKKVYGEDEMESREYFYVVFLNRANRIMGHNLVSMGGVSGTVVDPKMIFAPALSCGASAIIISHNHPSGNTSPSEQDIKLTRKLVECGKFLEISVLDHIIVTSETYYSFADEGTL